MISELSTKKKYQITKFIIKDNNKTVCESKDIAKMEAIVAITSLGRLTWLLFNEKTMTKN